MSANQYGITPGPWVVDSVNPELVAKMNAAGEYDYICDMFSGAYLQVIPDDQQYANARAIAEVPNMIEALADVTNALHALMRAKGVYDNPRVLKARATLARIKGEA